MDSKCVNRSLPKFNKLNLVATDYRIKLFIVLFVVFISSCSLAPKFERPKINIPQTYKENHREWTRANVKTANHINSSWWQAYNDKDLDALEARIIVSNNNLKAAVARYYEASALADQARAGYFPTVTANIGAERLRNSKTSPMGALSIAKAPYNDFIAGAYPSYEFDVWGKVRNMVKAATSQAKASAADLAFMNVSLHAELATYYFALRGDDASQIILDKIISSYEKELKITQNKYVGGIVAETAVEQAKIQLQNAKTQASDMRINRAKLEHAIAVLIGEVPSGFSIKVKKTLTNIPPSIPSFPSTLLEQRPDIAAAILRVEAANANIGVARTAYYPDFIFNSSIGAETIFLQKLISAPSVLWSFGPAASMTLFDGGNIKAMNAQARAAYDESVANYRQIVLKAFQDVEDNLAALRELKLEDINQKSALASSKRISAQATYRYREGISTLLDTITAQNAALQSELTSINIATSRLITSVLLIKALGGGWKNY